MAGRAVLCLWTLLWLCTGSGRALACPRCDAGIVARARVVEDGFVGHLLIALAPFVALALVSIWAERIGKARRITSVGEDT